jgi:hypothetical protein
VCDQPCEVLCDGKPVTRRAPPARAGHGHGDMPPAGLGFPRGMEAQLTAARSFVYERT